MRTFGASFATEIAKKATPDLFLTVGLLFAGNPVWLCDRRRSGTVNGNAVEPLIMAWGPIASALERAPEIVDIGNTTLTVSNLPVLAIAPNVGLRLGDLFGDDLLSVKVEIWMHAVKPDTTIVSEILLKGIVSSPTREEEDVIQLDIEPACEEPLQRSILLPVTKELYPNARVADIGGHFAWPMGTGRGIPCKKLNDSQVADQKQVWTVCESPAENPVTSIPEVYWERVKISQTPVSVEADGGSGIYPIDITAGGAFSMGSGTQQGWRQDNGADPNSGASTARIGPYTNDRSDWQPFVVPSHLINPRIVAITILGAGKVKVGAVDPAPLLVTIMDSLGGSTTDPYTSSSPGGPGGYDATGNVLGMSRVDQDDVATDPQNCDVVAAFSSVPVNPGQKLYLFLSAAVGVGTGTSSWKLALQTPNTAEGFSQSINGPFGNPSNGGLSYSIRIYYAIDGWGNGALPSSTELGDDPNAVSARVTEANEEIGLTEGIVAIGLELTLTRLPNATGSITAELSDVTGSVLGSCVWNATDSEFTGLAYGTYLDIRRYFTVPALCSGTVFLKVSGGLNGTSGLVTKYVSTPIFGGGYPPGGSPSGPTRYSMLMPNAPVQPKSTTGQPLHLSFKILPLEWTTHPTGLVHPGFAELRFVSTSGEPDIPDSVNIAAEVVATKYRPNDVIHALLNRSGIVDADIDLAGSFATSSAQHVARNYRFDSAITQQQTYKAFLIKYTFECRSVFDWQWDKAQVKFLPKLTEIGGSDRTFSRAEIANKADDGKPVALLGLQISRSERSEIVTVINATWDRQLDTGDYDNAQRFDSAPAIAKYGELSRDELFRFDYLVDRENAMVADVCSFWLEYFGFVKKLYAWTTDRRALGVEKEDTTDFDLDISAPGGAGFGEGGFGEGGFGGGTATFGLAPGKLVRVQRVQYDWEQRRIQLKAREV